MRNLYANLEEILDVCRKFSKNLVDERGNMPRRGVVPRFSDLEVIALSLTAEIIYASLRTIVNIHRQLMRTNTKEHCYGD